MKYLTLIPDYTQSCIQDDYSGKIALQDLKLPESLIDEVEEWHKAYRKIIPLSEEQRLHQSKKIKQLDAEGLRLAEEIRIHCPETVKIRYYSEGQYKYLTELK